LENPALVRSALEEHRKEFKWKPEQYLDMPIVLIADKPDEDLQTFFIKGDKSGKLQLSLKEFIRDSLQNDEIKRLFYPKKAEVGE
jgi:hypothetical protein